MKFTEGFWVRSERANASYASQGFYAKKTAYGMQIVAPERPVLNRADAMNISTITIDFIAYAKNNILVKAKHYEGYENGEVRFELRQEKVPFEVTITEQEAVLETGDVTVRYDRTNGFYRFEADGKILTDSGLRNLGYVRYDRKPASVLPEENYLAEDYKPYMVAELSLKAGERVYGFGEQFTAFVKNGQVINMFNEDGGTASEVAYKNIPFYMTNEGYGIFVDHTTPVSFEVASEKVEYVGFSVPGEEIRYHLIYGPSPKEILSRYTDMTGKPALPPAWSFGLWLTTSFTTNYDEKTTSSFIDGMAERNIPLRVFHFDCYWMKAFHWCDFTWDDETFSDVEEMLHRYKTEKGLKICCWINPYIAQGTDFFREGLEHGYFVMRKDGKGPRQLDFWQPGMALVDFTNPAATKWYTDKLRTLLDMGVDCFKTDFGERIPTDCVYYDKKNPEKMHNYYTYLYNEAVFEVLEKKKGKDEAVLFARSATAGGQKFPVHWGGDCYANYESMAESLRGGLSIGLSGFGFWSHDIGGFENTAPAHVYKRWCAFGLLSSHSRLHGSKSYRVPWAYDDESCDVVRFFTQLKCRMMPYLYREAARANARGTPMMRAMMMEFPDDPACDYLDRQYMLGDNVMVAPVFTEAGDVQFYLPEGRWTHLWHNDELDGSRWHKQQHGFLSLPVYVRDNTLLALGNNDQRPDYVWHEGTAFHLFNLQDGHEAVCEVPAADGSVIFTLKAARTGNTITVTGAGEAKNWTLCLRNVVKVNGLQDGSQAESEQGLVVKPQGNALTITL